ncbi:hypothetical protein THER5_1921 [Bifidobacterium thermacidophilum subsp. thermacidophilum]|uniref:Uncharacterized protein n=1 Tax=Bifidobacterium thermacidophilum subsp. thermacidophilum TaxID=79262 RepID=A0A087E331_9BIFI|nr:hypothetical protein THER5_1921 [Bifidobacterium thermacidophilum subsp. thermacidophilum]
MLIFPRFPGYQRRCSADTVFGYRINPAEPIRQIRSVPFPFQYLVSCTIASRLCARSWPIRTESTNCRQSCCGHGSQNWKESPPCPVTVSNGSRLR